MILLRLLCASVCLFSSFCHAQAQVLPSIEKLLATAQETKASVKKSRHVVFCWSKPDHPLMTHGYEKFATEFSASLSALRMVTAETVEGFPAEPQLQSADLVVFFLTLKALSDAQYALIDKHLAAGKSVIVLHQGLVQRDAHVQWADRIGFAFNWAKTDRSKWGQYENPITLKTNNPVLQGFPESITFKDELYWNMYKGRRGTITVLGTCRAPADKEPSDEQWPALWTVEHPNKTGDSGRVFCMIPGHFNYMHENVIWRTIVYRGIAWCLLDRASSSSNWGWLNSVHTACRSSTSAGVGGSNLVSALSNRRARLSLRNAP